MGDILLESGEVRDIVNGCDSRGDRDGNGPETWNHGTHAAFLEPPGDNATD